MLIHCLIIATNLVNWARLLVHNEKTCIGINREPEDCVSFPNLSNYVGPINFFVFFFPPNYVSKHKNGYERETLLISKLGL